MFALLQVAFSSLFRGCSASGPTGNCGSARLNGDGSVTYNSGTGTAAWVSRGGLATTPNLAAGIGNIYYIRTTKVSGAGTPSPAPGVWVQITEAGRTLANTGGPGALTMTVEYSRYSNGAVIENNGDITVNNAI